MSGRARTGRVPEVTEPDGGSGPGVALTHAADLAVGTNRRDDLALADRRFLLPALDLGTVLFLGAPSASELAAFTAVAESVLVTSPDPGELRELRRTSGGRGLDGVRLVAAERDALPLGAGTVSSAMIASAGVFHGDRGAALAAELDRVLTRRGSVCSEVGWGRGTGKLPDEVVTLARRGFAGPRVYRTVPPVGPTRHFLPDGDRDVARHFFEEVLHGRSIRKRALIRAGRWMARVGLLDLVLPRRLAVLWRQDAADGAGSGAGGDEGAGASRASGRTGGSEPPAYLVPLLRDAGLDPGALRAGLSVRGAYNSNKAVFFLFPRGRPTPEVVVKVTRATRYNRRLENEGSALSRLAEEGLLPRDRYPERLFLGRADGLAALGQRFVEGAPFRRATAGHARCPLAREAVATIVRLGEASAASAATTPVSGDERVGSLRDLLDRFRATCRPHRKETDLLREHVGRLGELSERVPPVFQHGDPGVWNFLVRPGGSVVLLDWEAAESMGMPLWDLFHFLRSFGAWISPSRERRSRVSIYERDFLEDGPLARLQAEAVRRYCRRVGVPPGAVEPLFYLCWTHRAVKEAARLSARDSRGGLYRRLLLRCVERRDAPGLRSLFAEDTSSRGGQEP